MGKNLGKIVMEIDPDDYSISVSVDCMITNALKVCILNSLATSLASGDTTEARFLLTSTLILLPEFSDPTQVQSYTALEDGTLVDNNLLNALKNKGRGRGRERREESND